MNEFTFLGLPVGGVSNKMADEAAWRGMLQIRKQPAPKLFYANRFCRYRFSAMLGQWLRHCLCVADAQQPVYPVVFASHDGEINRSFELWLSLLRITKCRPRRLAYRCATSLLGQCRCCAAT